jgi:hypothetical protein
MPAAAWVMLLAIALIVAVVVLSLLKVILQSVPGPGAAHTFGWYLSPNPGAGCPVATVV